jgi:hypothetical protein
MTEMWLFQMLNSASRFRDFVRSLGLIVEYELVKKARMNGPARGVSLDRHEALCVFCAHVHPS